MTCLAFKVVICPDEGFYKGGRFEFSFRVGPDYPHEPSPGEMRHGRVPPQHRPRGQRVPQHSCARMEPRAQRGLARCAACCTSSRAEPGGPAQQGGGRHAGRDSQLFASTVNLAMLGGTVAGKKFQRCLLEGHERRLFR
ncbi:hypothetical protein HPB48_025969 [Haemaphysalis longicornis]|uniref:UBC core domain-containing protein n=1 Tax=Haemaphysalis longicornis TaxID=44386 RepID=A0A9J6HAU7_HAELO|nr:hypothetical protein HPB48_025969 [Haemaphysalis longicornis]